MKLENDKPEAPFEQQISGAASDMNTAAYKGDSRAMQIAEDRLTFAEANATLTGAMSKLEVDRQKLLGQLHAAIEDGALEDEIEFRRQLEELDSGNSSS